MYKFFSSDESCSSDWTLDGSNNQKPKRRSTRRVKRRFFDSSTDDDDEDENTEMEIEYDDEDFDVDDDNDNDEDYKVSV